MEMARPFTFGSLAKWIFAPEHSEPKVYDTEAEVATSLTLGRPTWSQSDIVEEGMPFAKYERRYLMNNFEVEETIIADPDTRLIIRRIERQYEIRTRRLVDEKIKNRFTYNQPVPKGTFEMPKWKLKQRINMDAMTSKHMPAITDEGKKAGVETVIRSYNEAWRTCSWPDFAAVWKFQALTRLPSEADWRREFDKNTGDWTKWESSTQTIEMTSFIVLPTSYNSFQMLQTKKPVIHVRATLSATRSDRHWDGFADYYLQESRTDYRIIHAVFPVEEIEVVLKS